MRRTIGYAVAALAVFALISGCCMLPEKEAPRPLVTEEAETVEAEPEPQDPGLYVQLLGSPDGPAAEAHVDIFTAGTDKKIAGDWVNEERRFTIPSGTYDLVVHVADARIRREGVEVSEDEYQPVDVVLNAGTLELRFLDEADGELVNANVTICHAGDDENFYWDFRRDVEILVPAGSYDVAVEYEDGTNVSLEAVEVHAGETTVREVVPE